MSFEFRPAKRENVPLLLGVAGGTGSGKTYSALLLARGLAGSKPFAIIDTENGRAKHYADLFPEMQHGEIQAPFRPSKYADAIEAADSQGFPVIVVDSASHEWAGDGGCLDWHDEIMGTDQSKNFSAWGPPKKDHKRMVTRLLQVRAHVILCFRAEPKIEVIDDPDKPGKKKYVEKRSLTGLDGWIPISEKMLPYELTASFLLMADVPGVPRPIKLQEQHRPLVPLDSPLTEETGKALAQWAAGGAASVAEATDAEREEAAEIMERLLAHDDASGKVGAAIEKKRAAASDAEFLAWLRKQDARLPAPEPDDANDSTDGDQTAFPIPAGVQAQLAAQENT